MVLCIEVVQREHGLSEKGVDHGLNLAKTKISAKYNTVSQVDRLHGGTKPAHAARE
jgi:hypothetical protein